MTTTPNVNVMDMQQMMQMMQQMMAMQGQQAPAFTGSPVTQPVQPIAGIMNTDAQQVTPGTVSLVLTKIQHAQNALNQKFFERENEIEGIILGMLSKQNVLLIGEAGTAKSALISTISKAIQGANYFQWLVGQTTTPEELFGPLSLKDLEQGVYKRNTDKKLPVAHLAFLDEIFKTNSAILNSLLTLINERIFYNNGGEVISPLMSLVGASNEYPQEDGLEALFDRFMLRYEINYMTEKDSFIGMLEGQNVQMPQLTLQELQLAQNEVTQVVVTKEILETLFELRQDLKNEGIIPSDRRFKQSLSLLKAKAYLEGRQQVQFSDLLILGNALWVEPEQINKTREIVKEYSVDNITFKIQSIMADFDDIQQGIETNKGESFAILGNVVAEANAKLVTMKKELENLYIANPQRTDIESFIKIVEGVQRKNAELLTDV